MHGFAVVPKASCANRSGMNIVMNRSRKKHRVTPHSEELRQAITSVTCEINFYIVSNHGSRCINQQYAASTNQ